MLPVNEIRKCIKRYKELDSIKYTKRTESERNEIDDILYMMETRSGQWLCALDDALDEKNRELWKLKKLLVFIDDITLKRDGYTSIKRLGKLIDEVHSYARHPEITPIDVTENRYQNELLNKHK